MINTAPLKSNDAENHKENIPKAKQKTRSIGLAKISFYAMRKHSWDAALRAKDVWARGEFLTSCLLNRFSKLIPCREPMLYSISCRIITAWIRSRPTKR